MLKKEILLENEFIRKMPSREIGPAFNFRLGVWTVKWVSGIVFICAVVMVDKAMAPCGPQLVITICYSVTNRRLSNYS